MENYVAKFIASGQVYRSNRYDFLLLKDLIEFVRKTDLTVKIKDLQAELQQNGWQAKKASVLTDKGYQSANIWFYNGRVENTRPLPIKTLTRANLIEAEIQESERILKEIFQYQPAEKEFLEVKFSNTEVVFTNKGLKELLKKVHAKGSISKLSSIIRNKADKILIGEHFFGTSSRTVLFKNYYRLKK